MNRFTKNLLGSIAGAAIVTGLSAAGAADMVVEAGGIASAAAQGITELGVGEGLKLFGGLAAGFMTVSTIYTGHKAVAKKHETEIATLQSEVEEEQVFSNELANELSHIRYQNERKNELDKMSALSDDLSKANDNVIDFNREA